MYMCIHVITKCNKVHEIVPARELNQLFLERILPWHTCENVDKDCLFLGRVSKQIDTVSSKADCRILERSSSLKDFTNFLSHLTV